MKTIVFIFRYCEFPQHSSNVKLQWSLMVVILIKTNVPTTLSSSRQKKQNCVKNAVDLVVTNKVPFGISLSNTTSRDNTFQYIGG